MAVVEGKAKIEANSEPSQEQEVQEVPVEPLPNIEEVTPLDIIASLERDLSIAQAALRKVLRTNPTTFKGGPSNHYFGRRHEQAFEHCRVTAHQALQRMENYLDE